MDLRKEVIIMLKQYITKIISGENLTKAEAGQAMDIILSGNANESQIASFLSVLKMKGEAVQEIAGFAKTLIAHADRVPHARPVMCNCGTGGDTKNTFNISTTAAFILAAGGVSVAKHGNRGVSSASGSSDVLAELGVNYNLTPDKAGRIIDDIGIAFLFAPAFNKAMKYVAKTRKELGFRTVFNLLGPIINPAGLDYQMVGVYDASLTELVAGVLREMGVKHAMVIASKDGLDEISTNAKTKVTEIKQGELQTYEIDPADYGFTPGTLADYAGGSPKENAEITLKILRGEERGRRRDVVIMNAGAALYAGNKASSIGEGVQLAEKMLDSGRALQKLQQLIDRSRELSA